MFSLKLTALLLAGVAIAHVATDDQGVITINPEEVTGNYELQVVKEGPVTKVTFQNDESKTVTEIFSGEGYGAEKQEGSDECNITRLEEAVDPYEKCSYKIKVTKDDKVPATVTRFCGERTLYVVKSVSYKAEFRCIYYPACWLCRKCGCWRICCGIRKHCSCYY